MRFQSTAAFSRLSADLTGDAYGPVTAGSVTALAGQTTVLVAAPPAGQYNQIFSVSIRAATTSTDTGNVSVTDSNANNVLFGFYDTTQEIFKEWVGYLPFAGILNLRNSTSVSAFATVWLRTVPLPFS